MKKISIEKLGNKKYIKYDGLFVIAAEKLDSAIKGLERERDIRDRDWMTTILDGEFEHVEGFRRKYEYGAWQVYMGMDLIGKLDDLDEIIEAFKAIDAAETE